MDTKNRYQTDLTNRHWTQVCRVILAPMNRDQTDLAIRQGGQVCRVTPAPKPGGRPAKYVRRVITNALLYITRTGCQWRMLPKGLPPWRIVYWYFMQWKKDGTFDRL